jgi:uncharacterized iron-regulated protein
VIEIKIGRFVGCLLLIITLHGCANTQHLASTDDAQNRLNIAVQSKPIVLLGEIHDHAGQHAMRLLAFQNLLQQGKRPALLMEQFDREKQSAINDVRKQTLATATDIIAAGSAGKQGWNWDFYKPFLALALKHRLPIIAVNVSNADSMKAMRDGLGALDIQATPTAQVVNQQSIEIFNGHCKAMPMNIAVKMVNAQIAKDIVMAQLVTQHMAQGIVLLAGNGHIRNDIGVPHWLSSEIRQNSVSIGLLEAAEPHNIGQASELFDVAISTSPQPRSDPCEAFKKP